MTQEVETIVKASVMTPETGGQIHMVVGITQESPDPPSRTVTKECAISIGGGGGGEDFCSSVRAQHLFTVLRESSVL